MKVSSLRKASRRAGTIAPLTCVLLVVIFGMVAFAVDIGWLALTKSELQNTADSAALAGANRLGDNYVLFNLPGQSAAAKNTLAAAGVSAAKSAAKTYASYNTAGAVSKLALLDSDIDVGFTDAKGAYKSFSADPSNYPNTVKVTMRRDSSANTPLNLFFAPVLGIKTMNVTATAGATLYGGTIESFKVGSANSGVLPVTYDVNYWNNFLKTGLDPDGKIRSDSSGNPALRVYPSVKAPGNFGLLSLNDSHVGASSLSTWINTGMSPADIQALQNNNLIPLSSHNPAAWDWSGDTGFKASNVMDIENQVGKTFILPLFTPASASPYTPGVGLASQYEYNIVKFVGVKIMPMSPGNKEVVVQPAAISDPNMILVGSSIAPIGTTSIQYTAMAGAKLTQ